MFLGTLAIPEHLYEVGIPESLDTMQELVGINVVLAFSHNHVTRQYRPNFAAKTDSNGNEITDTYVRTHEKYYAHPDLQGKNFQAKYADRDILDELADEAAPRGMKVYARILEPYVITGAIPGFEAFAEVNAYGEKGPNVCFNHPEYIGYWHSVVEDLIRSHPRLEGFKFGQERGGPILSALSKGNPGVCFCSHCLSLAEQRGIDVEEARAGLIAIEKYGNRIREGEAPVDGNFVTFLRLLFAHPAVLDWEQFWMDSREAQRKRIYTQIKGIREEVQVGWHIDHSMTWDVFMRATWDYSKMGPYSDWLSVAVYFDSMGRRSLGHYQRSYQKILFGDATEEHSYPMYLSMLGYDPKNEPPLEQHLQEDSEFSSDYVYRECLRAVKAVNGQAEVHARPGFDMPSYDCDIQPEQVKAAVKAALDAGVDGLWCGREWRELKPENAQAFGQAVRDYRKA